MTRSQFAQVVSADQKWVENAARLLGQRLKHTVEESVWLGLVRVFNQEVGLTLARSAQLVDEALGHSRAAETVLVGRSEASIASVSVDLARYRSAHATRLSAALELGGNRRRGRRKRQSGKRAIEQAASYGVDVALLRGGLRLSTAERLMQLDDNAAFIREVRRASPSSDARRQ